jgi:CTP synthase (UTP-ammonia lyase)
VEDDEETLPAPPLTHALPPPLSPPSLPLPPQFRVGPDNICFVHVSLVPVLGSVGEQKTKPTQHSVKELRSVGLNPDIIICRSATGLSQGTREKLALFCQVPPEHVITVHDVSNIYHVPLLLEAQHASRIIASKLKLTLPRAPEISLWRSLAAAVDNAEVDVRIALVGKYTGLQDSYLSVIKSLQHAAIAAKRRLVVDWIDATALEPGTKESDADAYANSWETLRGAHGVLVPGGFGDRGVEGKILAVKYARENKVPFLGICLGMQCSVIEYARNVLGCAGANSAEFDPKGPHPVVIFMPEINQSQMGGTMRLGARATLLRGRADGKPSLAKDLYGPETKYVWERHRHRYEVNPDYVDRLQAAGLIFSGTDDRNQRMEIVELDREFVGRGVWVGGWAGRGVGERNRKVSHLTMRPEEEDVDTGPRLSLSSPSSPTIRAGATHPFFFASQYHPEFQSHPHRASAPFLGFVLAASGQLAGALPMQASVRRKASTGSVGSAGAGDAGASAPASPGRPFPSASPSVVAAIALESASEATAGSGAGAKPPLPPGAAAAAAAAVAAGVSSGSSSSTTASGNSSTQASPNRPVRQIGVPTMPMSSTVNSVAPPDGVRGGVHVPEGTFRANPC